METDKIRIIEESELIFAKPWQRLVAYSIDIVPLTLIFFVIFYIFLGFDQTLENYLSNRSDLNTRIDFLIQRNYIRDISLVCWIIYSSLMDCSKYQGTLGKKLLGIKVVDAKGHPITFSMSVKRGFGKLFAVIPCFLGFLWICFTSKKQGWHDQFAKTFVIVVKR